MVVLVVEELAGMLLLALGQHHCVHVTFKDAAAAACPPCSRHG